MITRSLYNLFLVATCSFFGPLACVPRFGNQLSTIALSSSNATFTANTGLSAINGTLSVSNASNNSIQGLNGSTLAFSGGLYANATSSYTITGTIDPTAADTIVLGSGDALRISAGQSLGAVLAKGSIATPSIITGAPIFSSTLTINNSSSALALGLQSSLAVSPVLNGGTLVLLNALALADGIFFSGNGTINCSGFTLDLPENISVALTNNITFSNAKNISLHGLVKLSGTWTFGDIGGTSFLSGNGNILDLSGGGVLAVGNTHTLYISDLHIKGLGAGLGSFSINAIGGTVKLSNVTLELGANYSHSQGQIYVNGDRCRLIYANALGGSYLFSVSSTGTVTVDHEVFEYDALGSGGGSPFSYTSIGTQQNLINGGIIRASGGGAQGSLSLVYDVTTPSQSMTSNFFLTSGTTVSFTNTLGTAQSINLNGTGYYIQFPSSGSGYLSVASLVTATLTNIGLRDFNPSMVSYGTSASLKFGSGTTVYLGADLTLSGASTPLSFVGNAVLDAQGHSIAMTGSSVITVGAGACLTIKDAQIQISNASAIAILAATGSVIFDNCVIFIGSSGFTFSTGSIAIRSRVTFYGCNEVTPGSTTLFTYSTGGSMTVLSNSRLEILDGLNFSYNPNPSVNSDTFAQSKRHLKMIDPSASILLQGCTFTTSATGLALDYGNLFIRDRVQATISTSTGADLELGSALWVTFCAGSIFDVDGPIKYTATTYP